MLQHFFNTLKHFEANNQQLFGLLPGGRRSGRGPWRSARVAVCNMVEGRWEKG
jgi:hypothetical protein